MTIDQTLGAIQLPDSQRTIGAELFRVGMLMLGLTEVVLLVTYGVSLNGSSVHTMNSLVVLPLVALVSANARVPGVPPRLRILYRVLPLIAGGLLVVTLEVGKASFPGSAGWWVPAALLSAAPFLAVALLHRTESDATGLRA